MGDGVGLKRVVVVGGGGSRLGDWDFKGLLEAYQQMRSHQTQEDGTDERSANAPPPPPPSSSVHSALSAADLRSQANTGGCIVSTHTHAHTHRETLGVS